MKSFAKYFVFFLLIILLFNITFSFCSYPDADGCFAAGSACTSDLNCISKKCSNFVCQPNHSQVIDINRILDKDALFEKIELTSESELKVLLFYNETISSVTWQKVSVMKKTGANWVNNELYSTNDSSRFLFDSASGYFDDGSKVYFNVAGWDACGSACRNYFEIFGGEGVSNTVEYLSKKPNGSLTSYQNDGIYTSRYRINSTNNSINLDCVNTTSSDYHNQLLYGNPTSSRSPSVVYNFTDYSSSAVSYSCTQFPVFFDKVNSKVAVTIHDAPGNIINPTCPYKYCEGSTESYPNFPYSCICLNDYALYHTPFVKINSDNGSVLFSFFQNNLKECTQSGNEFICKNYILNGFKSIDFESYLKYSQLDIKVIDNISYIATVVDSSKILLCNKNPTTDTFDCQTIVDLNYLADSSDASPKESEALIDSVSIKPYNGKLALTYSVQSSSNSFRENGVYLGYYTLPHFCKPSGSRCTINSDCCNNDCLLGTCSPCGLADNICPQNCTFEKDSDCLCGNGIIDVSENCANCQLDVLCGDGNYCDFVTKSCKIKTFVDSNCGNRIVDLGETCSSCPSDVKCKFNEECVKGVCKKINSITKFDLFVDTNNIYALVKCEFDTNMVISLSAEENQFAPIRVDCNTVENEYLLSSGVKEGIVYRVGARIDPECIVCSREDYILSEKEIEQSIPDNSLIGVILILMFVIGVIFSSPKK